MNKDERIAELEREVAEYKQQCYDCKHLHKKLELNIKNKLIGDIEKQNIIIQELENFKEKCICGDYIPAIVAKRFGEKIKELRHEICEKIRNYIDKEIYDRFQDNDVDYLTIDLEDFEDLLDQIERGEE